jgi:uridine kinase
LPIGKAFLIIGFDLRYTLPSLHQVRNILDTLNKPVVVGVAGGTGSGKTTVAARLMEQLGEQNIAYLPHDAYYRDFKNIPRADLEIVNFDHPDSLETSLLIDHVAALRRGESVEVPIYDFSTHSRSLNHRYISPDPVILIEGILIFVDPTLRALMDVRIYVDTDPDVRFIRRVRRDLVERGRSFDSVAHQYLETVRPMHLEFVEPSKRHAHVIVPEGGHNAVAIKMVADYTRALMHTRAGR